MRTTRAAEVDELCSAGGAFLCAREGCDPTKPFLSGACLSLIDPQQYLRKAEGFANNLKGATKSPVEGAVEGVVRYKKAGRYIDLAPDKSIISFGAQK